MNEQYLIHSFCSRRRLVVKLSGVRQASAVLHMWVPVQSNRMCDMVFMYAGDNRHSMGGLTYERLLQGRQFLSIHTDALLDCLKMTVQEFADVAAPRHQSAT